MDGKKFFNNKDELQIQEENLKLAPVEKKQTGLKIGLVIVIVIILIGGVIGAIIYKDIKTKADIAQLFSNKAAEVLAYKEEIADIPAFKQLAALDNQAVETSLDFTLEEFTVDDALFRTYLQKILPTVTFNITTTENADKTLSKGAFNASYKEKSIFDMESYSVDGVAILDFPNSDREAISVLPQNISPQITESAVGVLAAMQYLPQVIEAQPVPNVENLKSTFVKGFLKSKVKVVIEDGVKTYNIAMPRKNAVEFLKELYSVIYTVENSNNQQAMALSEVLASFDSISENDIEFIVSEKDEELLFASIEVGEALEQGPKFLISADFPAEQPAILLYKAEFAGADSKTLKSNLNLAVDFNIDDTQITGEYTKNINESQSYVGLATGLANKKDFTAYALLSQDVLATSATTISLTASFEAVDNSFCAKDLNLGISSPAQDEYNRLVLNGALKIFPNAHEIVVPEKYTLVDEIGEEFVADILKEIASNFLKEMIGGLFTGLGDFLK